MRNEFAVLVQLQHLKHECKTEDAARAAWIAALEWVIDDPSLVRALDKPDGEHL